MDFKDQAYNRFNSEGKLIQVEYGLEAAHSGYPIISLVCKNSIINVSKKVPKEALCAELHNSIYKISDNIFMNITGMPSDIDYVLNRAKILAGLKEYELACKLTPDLLCRFLADKFQVMIQRSGKRAPAFAATIFGFDNNEPILYYTDLSAIEYSCKAAAAGEDFAKIQKYLEKNYKVFDISSGLELAISALTESIGKDADPNELQVAVLGKEDGLIFLKNEEIDKILQKIAENNK